MLEGLERVFGALTFPLAESVQGYGGPQHFTRENRFASSSNCQRRHGPIHAVSEQAATPLQPLL